MDIQKAKELVILAGKKLIENGLIARTWGNISCRVNDHQFVITPSGRAYETLTQDDIVLINIEDLSYDGNIKPSSEKGIHAEVYKHHPDIEFVIHTHQVNASIVSTLGIENIPLSQEYSIIGSCIPVAEYALPGTKKLRKNISQKLTDYDSKAILMANHGVVCFGKDLEEAFLISNKLEKACESFLLDYYKRTYNRSYNNLSEINDFYLEKYNGSKSSPNNVNEYVSERIGNTIRLFNKDERGIFSEIDLTSGNVTFGEFTPEGELHRLIYNNRPDIRSIVHTKQEDILTVSKTGKTVYPLLDDFAQIIGASMKATIFNTEKPSESAKRVVKALKKNNGVFLKDNGALCCGPCKEDAYACELVTIKGCKAWISASMFGNVEPINKLESALMNFIYKNKYSKEKYRDDK